MPKKLKQLWGQEGDIAPIRIGNNTSVQDGSIVHCDAGVPAIIGNNVTIGHNVMLHACKIGDNSLIGIRAIVLDGANEKILKKYRVSSIA